MTHLYDEKGRTIECYWEVRFGARSALNLDLVVRLLSMCRVSASLSSRYDHIRQTYPLES